MGFIIIYIVNSKSFVLVSSLCHVFSYFIFSQKTTFPLVGFAKKHKGLDPFCCRV
jgi:hypothetical protein